MRSTTFISMLAGNEEYTKTELNVVDEVMRAYAKPRVDFPTDEAFHRSGLAEIAHANALGMTVAIAEPLLHDDQGSRDIVFFFKDKAAIDKLPPRTHIIDVKQAHSNIDDDFQKAAKSY